MKITIVGDAYCVKSSLTTKMLEFVSKYQPDALKIKDDEGNETFSVSYKPGRPNISKFGVTFGGESRDSEKLATVTGTIPTGVDAKEWVAEIVGPVVKNLREIEAKVPAVATEIENERAALVASITVD